MDVMKPELLWIDGRCYRINHCIDRSSSDAAYAEEDFHVDYNEFEHGDEFEVESLEDGRFKTSFHVAKCFFPCIIGMKGNTRRRIENETKTQVKVPKQGQDGEIVVVGGSRGSVGAARRRILLVVLGTRFKQPFTHFVSLPVNGASVQEGFQLFKERVLGGTGGRARGVDASLFQAASKLHLTLCTLVLADASERQAAAAALQQAAPLLLREALGGPLRLRLRGVEYMNDDPRQVDVLYAKVEDAEEEEEGGQTSQRLQRLADALVAHFADAPGGFCERQYDSVKLHVTLMNTLFRAETGDASDTENKPQGGRNRNKSRESFDATSILEEFKDFVFGEEEVEVIHLSQRFTTSADGYYQASATLSLL